MDLLTITINIKYVFHASLSTMVGVNMTMVNT